MSDTPLPTPQQLAWQDLEIGVFLHVGVNTFAGVEWSDGTLPAASFDPSQLDARQWVRTARQAGARYVVLTAKHHDGFCLWPTATTSYSVASSPWLGGRGDVVREVADACAEQGLALGLYLSPWDRNAPQYADPDAYDAFYLAQLRELCTGYGPLVEVWFDGAGSAGRSYDWTAIVSLVRELQPDAMIFNMGAPTVRWIGNEDGLASDPVDYVVPRTANDAHTDHVLDLHEARYLPPEADVSLRRGWFWSPDDRPKSLDHLLAIYYRSVGMGANLLLNVPPDDRGLIPDADVARLREWRAELDRRFADPIDVPVRRDGSSWTATFDPPVTFDHVELAEDLSRGQRIRGHRVLADGRLVAEGLTIGHKRLHVHAPVTARSLTVEADGGGSALLSMRLFATGVSEVPEVGYLAATQPPA